MENDCSQIGSRDSIGGGAMAKGIPSMLVMVLV